jgi:hypothetical protein
VSLDGNTLRVSLVSRLRTAQDGVLTLGQREQAVALPPGRPVTAAFDLGPPAGEADELLGLTLRAGGLELRIERGLRTAQGLRSLAAWPEQWRAGMRLRKQEERFDFGETRAQVHPQAVTCGGVTRKALFMHPPWTGGVGYAFALFDPVKLPKEPSAAFRAVVGKGDGSDPGDGILYQLAVLDEKGRETVAAQVHVGKHEWRPIEADLTPWAGQAVRFKLIADVGPNDNSGGDWAAWAEMRIESREAGLIRTLDENPEAYARAPGPFPIVDPKEEDLRAAKRGWLRYDGIGLEGAGSAYVSYAVLNGVELGPTVAAGGDEVHGVWAQNAGVALTPEAIRSLRLHNRVALRNPNRDCFKVRRFWIELEWPDGRKGSSAVSTAVFTQPPEWTYAEGIRVPQGRDIRVGISFRP